MFGIQEKIIYFFFEGEIRSEGSIHWSVAVPDKVLYYDVYGRRGLSAVLSGSPIPQGQFMYVFKKCNLTLLVMLQY